MPETQITPIEGLKIDEVGPWTEVKLKILRDYSQAYATILRTQQAIKSVAYVDGFAGAGSHISKGTGLEIPGSPQIALGCEGFTHYHFIDMDGARANRLRQLSADHPNAQVHEGDCNEILLREVFPRYRWEDFRRALCLLDPYKLNPNWEVVAAAGKMKSVEIFLNFMIMDVNMNVLLHDPAKAKPSQIERMNTFWGDDSWRTASYKKEACLFGEQDVKEDNEAVAEAYRERLRNVAGFKYVPEPLPMKNRNGATIYYLFFASHNQIGDRIARDVFNKYR